MEKSYLPIQSLDIEAEKRITFDLFLNLPLNNKILLYRRRGGELESHRLEQLIQGNVQNFLIRREDYNEFVKYVASRLRTLIDNPDPGAGNKMAVSAARSILSSTFQTNNSAMVDALMGNLNQITGILIEGVLERTAPSKRQAFRKLMQIAEKGTDFHKHPVNVTSMAVLMAFGIGYNTDKILADVAMGALLHDIGTAKLPTRVAMAAHDVLALTPDDRKLLYEHGRLGLEILDEKKIRYSEIVRAIVMQHHEEFNGGGYPAGLRGHVVNEFAQVVRVADDIDHLVRFHPFDAETLSSQLDHLFNRYYFDKVIEPSLATRIRGLFL